MSNIHDKLFVTATSRGGRKSFPGRQQRLPKRQQNRKRRL